MWARQLPPCVAGRLGGEGSGMGAVKAGRAAAALLCPVWVGARAARRGRQPAHRWLVYKF